MVVDRKAFWDIINGAQSKGGGNLDARYQAVFSRLMDLPGNEIIDFQRILGELLREAYRWDLWAAAYIVNGGCSDDSFQDFRRWLISRGERAFFGCCADPESLAEWERGEDDLFFEDFGWVAREAHKMSIGRNMSDDLRATAAMRPPMSPGRSEPAGVRWEDDAELARRFPKLWNKYWGKER